MEFREFLSGCEDEVWQMLEVMRASDGAFVRLDDHGRIIAQTDRAEHILCQSPMQTVYEVLGELAAHTIRVAIDYGETMRTRDVIDGHMVNLTICPGQRTHLLYLEPQVGQGDLLRDQIVEQRLRTALSVLALNQPNAHQRTVLQIARLLHELELLNAQGHGLRPAQRVDLGELCKETVTFAQRCTVIPITLAGQYTPIVCTPDEIRMALYHLLTNAIRAAGVNQIVVRWGCEMPGSVFFEVADDGQMLSEDAFAELCVTHQRVGTVNGIPPSIDGHMAGLGLPAVCEIAMRHGGGVSLCGAPEGKAIRVTLCDDLIESPHTLRMPVFSDGYSLQETELSVLYE